MKKAVGLWIDHRKTVIVSVTDKGEETSLIKSDMEKHVRYSGAAQEDSAEDPDTRFTGHLNKYYDQVISRIRDADPFCYLVPARQRSSSKNVWRVRRSADGSLVLKPLTR